MSNFSEIYLSISGILVVILATTTAIFVSSSRKINRLNISWIGFSISIAVWGAGLAIAFRCSDASKALLWSRVLNSAAIFIPAFFLGFVDEFFCNRKLSKQVWISYGIATLLFLSAWIFPNHFVPSVSPKMSFSFYPNPGFLYYLFAIQFFTVVSIGFIKIIQRIQSKTGDPQKNWIVFTAMAIGFGGGATTFPLVFNFEIFPVGAICPAILATTIAYAITKLELMDIKIGINKIGAFYGTILLFCSGYIAWLIPYRIYISESVDNLFIATSCIYWIASAGLYFQRVQRFLQTTAYKKFLKFNYDFDETLKAVSSRLIVAQRTTDVVDILTHMQDSLEIGQCYAFLRRNNTDPIFDGFLIQRTALDQDFPIRLPMGEFDFSYPLLNTLDSQFDKVQRVSNFSPDVQHSLAQLGVTSDSVCLSIHSFQTFQAAFIVGQRLNEETYTDKDIALFEVVTNQAIIVFERITKTQRLMGHQKSLEDLNTQLHEINRDLEIKVQEAVDLAKKHFHQAAFATLASGMAHEIRNPMAAMVAAAGFMAESVDGRKLQPTVEFGEWERPIRPADFIALTHHDVTAAKGLLDALIAAGILPENPTLADVLHREMGLVELPDHLKPFEAGVQTALIGLSKLATLFDFVNVVNQEVPRILDITQTMMKYGVSGGGVKPDSFTKIHGVSDADSAVIFDVLLYVEFIDRRGGVLPKFSPSDGTSIATLEKLLPEHLKELSYSVVNVICTTPGAIKQPVNVVEILGNTLRLLDGICKKKLIQVVREIPGETLLVAGDDHRLQQAFFNVAYNAIQAMEHMEGVKQLIVRAKAHTHVTPDNVAMNGVQIQFQDTGPGISDELKDKIFNPFFTTKGPTGGKNVGLGLSILKEVIAGHNGVVEVASTVGDGTTFLLFIPGYVAPD